MWVFQLPALSIHLSSALFQFLQISLFWFLGLFSYFWLPCLTQGFYYTCLNCIIFSFTGSNYVELSFEFLLRLSDCLKEMASLYSSGTVLNYPRKVSVIYHDCFFLCMYFNLGNFLGMAHFAFCIFCTIAAVSVSNIVGYYFFKISASCILDIWN